jgi:hypothetical protein
MWTSEHSVEAKVRADVIRTLFEDVEGWPGWNAGTEWVRLDGPFAVGTAGTMKVPDQEPFNFRLIAVGPDGFEDETPVPDAGIVVRVRHSVEAVDDSTVRITYRTTIDGPAADTVGPVIGPEITADFPSVLDALVARAQALITTS